MGRAVRAVRLVEADPIAVAIALRERERSRTFEAWLRSASSDLRWDFPHLVAIREQLDRVSAGEVKRLAIAVPPQHGKSSLATIRYPVWRIIRDPRLRVLIGSYNEEKAADFSTAARKVAADWVSFAPDVNRVDEWQTTVGGGIKSIGTTSGTGRPAELVIIDDPFKDRTDADSLARREAVWNWYTEVILSRRPQAIVVIQTRWHEDDLIGRLLSRPAATPWTYLRLPALAEEGDPLHRPLGAPLCPELMTLEQLEEQRAINPFSFEALYQGSPSPREGNLIQVSNLLIAESVPDGLTRVRAWDMGASRSTKADRTAGVLVAGPDAGGLYYILDVVAGHWEPAERNVEILRVAQEDGQDVPVWGPEDPGPHGKEAALAFVRLLDGYQVAVSPILKRAGTPESKQLRAEPWIAQVNGGNVRMVKAPWNDELIDEHRRFPSGRRDDTVDAAALAHAALRNALPPGDYGIF